MTYVKRAPVPGCSFRLIINGVDLLGDGFIIAGDRMAVHVERLRHAAMSQPTGDFDDGDAVCQQQRGVGMPQAVEIPVGQVGLGHEVFPHLFYRFRTDRRPGAV